MARIGLDVAPALDGPSGMSHYVEGLLEGLAAVDRENEYVLCAFSWRARERAPGIRRPRASNFKDLFARAPQRLLLPLEELGLPLREGRLKRAGIELYHGLGNIAPPLSRIPTVVTLHHTLRYAPSPFALWDRFYLNFLTDRSVRRARAVIAVSEFSRREAVRLHELDPDRVHAVYEGGPSVAFRPGTPSPPASRYFLHVGGFFERKNIPTLVRAFGLWLKRNPDRRERLVLVGRPGPDSGNVAAIIAELGLGSRVDVVGALGQEELAGLYRGAVATVIPSRLEGFGFPALESMACGTPVLATTSGAIPEVAGKAALYFDPDDVEGLAALLHAAATDRARAEEHRALGLERVRRFSWEETARRTASVYRQVLKT